MRKNLLLVWLILLLVACHPLDPGTHIENDTKGDTEAAKKLFEEDERLVRSAAVFHKDQLVSAVTVKTFSRFHKRKIEKDLQEKLEKKYPNYDVTVSADYKAMYMLSKILVDDEEQQVEKELEEIVKLLKEET